MEFTSARTTALNHTLHDDFAHQSGVFCEVAVHPITWILSATFFYQRHLFSFFLKLKFLFKKMMD
jgi:hypothetical protein